MNDDFMFYPSFSVGERVTPEVPLPRDYQTLLKRFYEQDRKKEIEYFVCELRKVSSDIEIRLKWDEKNILGLTNISLGVHGGFDLQVEERIAYFQEHNLHGRTSYLAVAIALNYVRELVKCRE